MCAAFWRGALADGERGLGASAVGVEDEALDALVGFGGGDARVALNTMELAVRHAEASERRS